MAAIDRAGQKVHKVASCRVGGIKTRSFASAACLPTKGWSPSSGQCGFLDRALSEGRPVNHPSETRTIKSIKAHTAGRIRVFDRPFGRLSSSQGFLEPGPSTCPHKQNAPCCSLAAERQRAGNIQKQQEPTFQRAFVLADLQAPLVVRDANGSPLIGGFGLQRGLAKELRDAEAAKDQRKRVAAEQARLILDRLLQGRRNGTPDEKTLGAHLEWLCDQRTFGLLMKELGTASWGDTAGGILSFLRKVGRSPDTRGHSEALRALGRVGQTDAALQILREMTSSGPPPDVWCYSEVLKALASAEDVGGALATFAEINERGVAPNVWCCNSLVTVLCKGGRVREARGILEAMRRGGGMASEGSVTTLSGGSVNTPQGERERTETSESGRHEQVGSFEQVELTSQTGVEGSAESRDAPGGLSDEWMTAFDEKEQGGAVRDSKGGRATTGKASRNSETKGKLTMAGGKRGERSGHIPSVVRSLEACVVERQNPGDASVAALKREVQPRVAGGILRQPADEDDVSVPAPADIGASPAVDHNPPTGDNVRLLARDDVSMLLGSSAAAGPHGRGRGDFEGHRETGRENVAAMIVNGDSVGVDRLLGVSSKSELGTLPHALAEGFGLKEVSHEADREERTGAEASGTTEGDPLRGTEDVTRSSQLLTGLEVLKRAMLGSRQSHVDSPSVVLRVLEADSASKGDPPGESAPVGDPPGKGRAGAFRENRNVRLDNGTALRSGVETLEVDSEEERGSYVERRQDKGLVQGSGGGGRTMGEKGAAYHGRTIDARSRAHGSGVDVQTDGPDATLARSDGSRVGSQTDGRNAELADETHKRCGACSAENSGDPQSTDESHRQLRLQEGRSRHLPEESRRTLTSAEVERQHSNKAPVTEPTAERERSTSPARSSESSRARQDPLPLKADVSSGMQSKADVRNGVQSKADVRRALQRCLRWGAKWPADWPPPPAPDAVTYNVLIGASDGWRTAVELLEGMKADGVAPTQITYNSVLTSCSRAGEWERCMDFWNALQAARLPRNDFALSCIVRALGAAHWWEQAVEMVKAAKKGSFGRDCKLSVQTCTMAISACAQSRQRQAAVALLRWMQKEGLKPDVGSYNAVMQACIQAEDLDEALQFFQELLRARLRPDSHSQTLYIHVLALCGRFTDALDAFWGFRTRLGVPNIVTYNAAIVACGKGLMWMDAFKVFQDLDASGCAPNVTTYEALIKALSDSGELEKAMAVFQSMGARGVKPQVRAFNNLLDGYAELGAWEDARAIFDSMQRFGVRPDVVSHNILIRAYWRGGQFASAVSCFASMLEGDVTCPPDDFTYRGVLTACDLGGLGAEALWALEQMEILGGSPSAFHYGRALVACAKGGTWADVEELYQYMRGEAMEIEASVYMAMLARLEVEGNTGRARGVLAEWRESVSDYEIGVGGYNLVLGAYASAGDWREALAWKEVMEARGITPSVTTYSMLVGVLEKSGRWQEAMAVYGEMPMKGGVL
ncbi:putative Pentatricopeptide repeat domain containing protein [Klebsormidium nitens]|uniref:Putative Pentatricopeptide repeat domain containing protein n=1 Tax=Klebsormidium nitens TaxID=105231 RepID=A0A1Y1IBP4_KLENI|nr:putative Pentatricopeptide repeat domain containing protein [Klebsormidium nitens]|eukprot:GAQ86147.1 putative Pentatricopeptide repeat domain containing protein [Klebsormidium nitens]